MTEFESGFKYNASITTLIATVTVTIVNAVTANLISATLVTIDKYCSLVRPQSKRSF